MIEELMIAERNKRKGRAILALPWFFEN